MWIKVTGPRLTDSDIFIGAVYLSPERKTKKNTQVVLQELMQDVNCYKKKGNILLLGDFNARTGDLKDFIHVESHTFGTGDLLGTLLEQDSEHIPPRNSVDKKTSARGRELVEICKNHDLCILNGRKMGDIFGEITCWRYNGCSLVDYGICSKALFKNIISFKIEPFWPHLSDHSALTTEISFATPLEVCLPDTDNTTPLPQTLFWDPTGLENFKRYVKDVSFSEIFADFKANLTSESPDMIVEKFSEFLKITALESGIQYKRKTKKQINTPNQIWFDIDCVAAKNEIIKLGKEVAINRHKLFLLKEKKKQYRLLIRQKKNSYFNNQATELAKDSKSPTKFWKRLNKLRMGSNNTRSEHFFKSDKVISYFQKLLKSDRDPIFEFGANNYPIWDKEIERDKFEQSLNSKRKISGFRHTKH